MPANQTLWGVHMGAHVAERPIDGDYVAIGWQEVGDLTQFPADREAYKVALIEGYPDKKPGAIPVDAGAIYKFVYAIQAGDLVAYPSKSDRMVNIGRFTGSISCHEEDPDGYGRAYLRRRCSRRPPWKGGNTLQSVNSLRLLQRLLPIVLAAQTEAAIDASGDEIN